MINFSYSPITGGEGNIEFLMILKYNSEKLIKNKNINIEHIINNAHNHFK
jgi:hemolysin A